MTRWYDPILAELSTVLWVLLALLVGVVVAYLPEQSDVRDPMLLVLGALITRIRTPRSKD